MLVELTLYFARRLRPNDRVFSSAATRCASGNSDSESTVIIVTRDVSRQIPAAPQGQSKPDVNMRLVGYPHVAKTRAKLEQVVAVLLVEHIQGTDLQLIGGQNTRCLVYDVPGMPYILIRTRTGADVNNLCGPSPDERIRPHPIGILVTESGYGVIQTFGSYCRWQVSHVRWQLQSFTKIFIDAFTQYHRHTAWSVVHDAAARSEMAISLAHDTGMSRMRMRGNSLEGTR